MEISAKLQIKPGRTVSVTGAPADIAPLADPVVNPAADPGRADVVIAFVRTAGEIDTAAASAVAAARQDRLAWVAYPKAGQLGTDLNRDILAGLLTARGLQPVRQVAVDATWSALRFRPA